MHSGRILKNVGVSFICKIVALVIGFISRKIFLVVMGEELLGLSSLYSNLLDLLNMTELGIGTAVSYSLYKPIAEKDTQTINSILYSAKKVYAGIGTAVFVVGLVLSVFIRQLIKDNSFDFGLIQASFLFYVCSIAGSYFWVHKRLYLQTNEELFLVNIADTALNIIISLVKIIVVIATRNFLIYVGLSVVQTFLSNLMVDVFCRIKHPDITGKGAKHSKNINWFSDLKYVIPLRINAYIYKSTDNIIISKFLGLTLVALYSNYIMITNQVLILYNQVMNIIQTSMGVYLNEIKDKKQVYNKIQQLQFINFFCSSLIITEIIVLLPCFICVWLGESYLLSDSIPWLLAIDMFLFMSYQPFSLVFSISGKFREDKNITLGIAICNIILSLWLVGPLGIAGVVIGTLVSDILSFIFRIYKIEYLYFKGNIVKFVIGYGKNIVNVIVDIVCSFFMIQIFVDISKLSSFFICSIILAVIVIIINILFNIKNPLLKECLGYIRRIKF